MVPCYKRPGTAGKAAGVLRLVFHDAGTFEIDDNRALSNMSTTIFKVQRLL
ncbi:hypothetical protein MTR_3g111470 [Medicago truncatula]|uniref:Plant heme peroxidase family profile domain-containing protein n=1 Tax=Medicago truncatula TaxID=3880 RepID=G7J4M5_MEDTR|nr:hypothetical protein MTR_3g111470 [Medicago truncatula]